jgi:DNA polymerase I-like protein with 3'-5' exonuclease and polymerase domains
MPVKYDREFRDRSYQVRIWNGDAIPRAAMCAMDTETEYIVPGKPIVPVILQVAYSSGVVDIVPWRRFDEYLDLFQKTNPETPIAMHNAGFDVTVLGWRDRPWLEEAIDTGRIIDTGGRFYLRQLAKGLSPKEYPGLGLVIKTLFGHTLDKDGEARYTFNRGMKMTAEHIYYAAEDAIVTLAAAEYMDEMPTELEQMWMTVASQELQHNGMLVDRERFDALKLKFSKQLGEYLAVLSVFGYIPGAPGNQKVLQEILEMIEDREGFKFKRTTKTGNISTKDDYLVGLDVKHPFLDAYKKYVHINKMVGTYLNDEFIAEDGRVHPYYNALVRSGRTSCRGPNAQNVPGDEGLRGIYVAPPGKVWAAVDYDQIELCALAESNYERFQFSKQGDMINADICCHCHLASQFYGMPYEELHSAWKSGDPKAKKMRANGKPGNFGGKMPN